LRALRRAGTSAVNRRWRQSFHALPRFIAGEPAPHCRFAVSPGMAASPDARGQRVNGKGIRFAAQASDQRARAEEREDRCAITVRARNAATFNMRGCATHGVCVWDIFIGDAAAQHLIGSLPSLDVLTRTKNCYSSNACARGASGDKRLAHDSTRRMPRLQRCRACPHPAAKHYRRAGARISLKPRTLAAHRYFCYLPFRADICALAHGGTRTRAYIRTHRTACWRLPGATALVAFAHKHWTAACHLLFFRAYLGHNFTWPISMRNVL